MSSGVAASAAPFDVEAVRADLHAHRFDTLEVESAEPDRATCLHRSEGDPAQPA
jgi:hypothetical protein